MLAQGETFYPAFVDTNGYFTAGEVLIFRPRDGAFLDWGDFTFKTTGWSGAGAGKSQSMAKVDVAENLWTYATGWVLPYAFDEYHVIYRMTDGPSTPSFEGGTIEPTYERVATVNDAAATVTGFVTDLTETTDNFWNAPSLVMFLDGVLAGQTRKITGYTGATKKLASAAFTQPPGNGDKFKIINQ